MLSEQGRVKLPRFIKRPFLMLLLMCPPLSAYPADMPQRALAYQLKAAYLLNFARFTDWPVNRQEGERPFRFCIIGQNPFLPITADLEQESIGAQQVQILHSATLESLENPAGCHILFFKLLDAASCRAGLNQIRSLPILTVGEDQDFLKHGGIIQFVEKDTRLQFGINLEQLKHVKLHVNPHLLKRALFTFPPQDQLP